MTKIQHRPEPIRLALQNRARGTEGCQDAVSNPQAGRAKQAVAKAKTAKESGEFVQICKQSQLALDRQTKYDDLRRICTGRPRTANAST